MISTEALPNLSRVVESKIGDHFADAVSIPARVREALDRAIIIAGGEEAIVTLDVVGKSLTINGALQQGLLEDRFELEVEPTFGDVSLPFRAKELKVALSEPADRFYLAPTAAAFFSADESYTHVVATHSDK